MNLRKIEIIQPVPVELMGMYIDMAANLVDKLLIAKNAIFERNGTKFIISPNDYYSRLWFLRINREVNIELYGTDLSLETYAKVFKYNTDNFMLFLENDIEIEIGDKIICQFDREHIVEDIFGKPDNLMYLMKDGFMFLRYQIRLKETIKN